MNAPTSQYVSGAVQDEVLVASFTVNQLRDSDTTFAARDELLALIDSSGARHVVLDTRRLNFIGSIGLLAFLTVRRHVVHGRVVICNMSEQVQHLFSTCRLISTNPAKAGAFESATTVEKALELIRD